MEALVLRFARGSLQFFNSRPHFAGGLGAAHTANKPIHALQVLALVLAKMLRELPFFLE
jgi:hypothetical protein